MTPPEYEHEAAARRKAVHAPSQNGVRFFVHELVVRSTANQRADIYQLDRPARRPTRSYPLPAKVAECAVARSGVDKGTRRCCSPGLAVIPQIEEEIVREICCDVRRIHVLAYSGAYPSVVAAVQRRKCFIPGFVPGGRAPTASCSSDGSDIPGLRSGGYGRETRVQHTRWTRTRQPRVIVRGYVLERAAEDCAGTGRVRRAGSGSAYELRTRSTRTKTVRTTPQAPPSTKTLFVKSR